MAAVTKERIFAAADQLDAEGKNPTLAAVRQVLGAGSFTTISEGLNEWKAQRAAKAKPATEPAPELLTAHLADFGANIWALALEAAGARFAADREALEATKAQLEAERAEAVELADEVTAELEAMKAQLVTLTAAEQEARKAAADALAQVAGITERAATAETRAAELDKRAGDLNAELERLNLANAELVKALAAAAAKKQAKA